MTWCLSPSRRSCACAHSAGVRRRSAPRDNAEFAVLAVLVQDWDAVAPWLAGPLFSDTANRQAFEALVESDGDLEIVLERLDGQARDVVERAQLLMSWLTPDGGSCSHCGSSAT